MSACEQMDARFEKYNTTFHATRAFVRQNWSDRPSHPLTPPPTHARTAPRRKHLFTNHVHTELPSTSLPTLLFSPLLPLLSSFSSLLRPHSSPPLRRGRLWCRRVLCLSLSLPHSRVVCSLQLLTSLCVIQSLFDPSVLGGRIVGCRCLCLAYSPVVPPSFRSSSRWVGGWSGGWRCAWW